MWVSENPHKFYIRKMMRLDVLKTALCIFIFFNWLVSISILIELPLNSDLSVEVSFCYC